MKKLILLILFVLALPAVSEAQNTHPPQRIIEFPDIPGFLTLKCDLHIHSVFSDGSVWPDIRVQEAIRDGLDAISLTEHLEYQPHKDDIPHPDRNRAFVIASDLAKNSNLIILPGSEITRNMPPGHANAIFIEDANRLLVDDSLEVFREAKRQGAFIFWNHPNWTSQRKDGVATLTDMHLRLIREGLLSGIEVVNETTYSDEALQIALDYDLAIIGSSDIHGLIDWKFKVPEGGHRPVTLVFSKERSAEGIQEGLNERRTAVWFNNMLIGREEFVVPLIEASLSISKAAYTGDSTVLRVTIENSSDVTFILDNQTDYLFHASSDVLTVEPNHSKTLEIKTLDRKSSITLVFEVLNAVTAPNTHPEISLTIPVE